MQKRKVIIILGPTASGKSDIALKLAKKHNGFLISADSRQIYKGMDIGTNKDIGTWQVVNGEEKYLVDGLPLYLVDQLEPDQEFTVVDWRNRVIELIEAHPSQLPIIVGGTGLYISALVKNFSFAEGKINDGVREKLEKDLKKFGTERMWKRLVKLDPYAEEIVDKKNPRRVLRALEACMIGNKPFSEQLKTNEPMFDFLQIGINIPRETLYKKIDGRVDQMIGQGLLEEVKKLNQQGFSWDLTSMSGIGYKQIGMFLRGEVSLEQAVELIKRDTRHYAKRQMTWFSAKGGCASGAKPHNDIKWVKNFEEADKLVAE
ncbi:MAG: tRNA (adenosine(37)-N6)-dimethylallyltransferase MiaA [Candidatus Falkowbacteria bacterium]